MGEEGRVKFELSVHVTEKKRSYQNSLLTHPPPWKYSNTRPFKSERTNSSSHIYGQQLRTKHRLTTNPKIDEILKKQAEMTCTVRNFDEILQKEVEIDDFGCV